MKKQWTRTEKGWQPDGPMQAGIVSVTPYTPRYGRGALMEQLQVRAGSDSMLFLPDRGGQIHEACISGVALGWDSGTGVVNPALGFVDSAALGGLGWLRAFGGWGVRCGMRSMGATSTDELGIPLSLHGTIDLTPADEVGVTIESETGEVSLRVAARDVLPVLGSDLYLNSTTTLRPAEKQITLLDTVTNSARRPGPYEILYHLNFGNRVGAKGARFLAPYDTAAPRDADAARYPKGWEVYDPDRPEKVETVYFFDLHAGPDNLTRAMLISPDGDMGVSVIWDKRRLPCLTLWQLCTGEVVGVEPGTNWPTPYQNELTKRRIRTLAHRESAEHVVTVLVHPDRASVADGRRAVDELCQGAQMNALPQPNPAW